MKKVMSILLAAVIMLLCLSGCGGDDAKLYFPDNSSLKLTASEEEIIKAQNLELVNTQIEDIKFEKYIPNDDSLTEIDGIQLSCSYNFNDNHLLSSVSYSTRSTLDYQPISEEVSNEEGIVSVYEQLTEYLKSVYGQPKEHKLEDAGQSGYYWDLDDSQGNSFKLTVFTTQYSFDDSISSAGVEVIRQ